MPVGGMKGGECPANAFEGQTVRDVRIINDVIELLCAQAAGVEQRVALGGSAVSDDAFALGLQLSQQRRQFGADTIDPLREPQPGGGGGEFLPSGGILDALPMPLGSLSTLGFAGPKGTPLIAELPAPAPVPPPNNPPPAPAPELQPH